MKARLAALLAAMLASAGAPAQGAGHTQDGRRFQWQVQGGYAITTGRTADFLDNGWSIGTGLTFRPVPDSPFSLRGNLNLNHFNATNRLIALGQAQNQTRIDDGLGRVVSLDVDAVLDVPFGPRARGYLFAGVGGDWRRIELTQTVAFGGYFCDPWYGYCDYGFFPGDVLIQRESTTRFAWNAGMGLEFPWYGGQSWFVETRFEQMQTRSPTTFIPLRVGLRF